MVRFVCKYFFTCDQHHSWLGQKPIERVDRILLMHQPIEMMMMMIIVAVPFMTAVPNMEQALPHNLHTNAKRERNDFFNRKTKRNAHAENHELCKQMEPKNETGVWCMFRWIARLNKTMHMRSHCHNNLPFNCNFS